MRALVLALAFAVCFAAQLSAGIAEASKRFDERNFAEAERLCRAELATLAEKGEGGSDAALPFLNLLARAITLRGHVPDALPVARESMRIAGTLYPPDDPRMEDSIEALAFVYRWSGKSAQSRMLLERIVALRQKAYGSNDARTLDAMDTLATDLLSLRSYDEAAAIFTRSIAVRAQDPSRDRHRYIQATMALGMTRWRQKRLTEARTLLERALELRLRESGEWDVYTAATIHNLSLIVNDLGDLRTGLELEERALHIRERVWGAEHPNVANGLFSIGMTQLLLGRTREARESFERSLRMRRNTLGDDHRETGQSINALAFTYIGDDLPRAIDLALESRAIQANWLRANIRGLSEREALQISNIRWGNLNVAIGALRKPAATPELRRKVWDAVVRGRSLVLDEMMWRKSLPDQERLAAARGAYSRKLLGGRGKLDAAAYTRELAALRQDAEAAERDLAARNQRFGQARQQDSAGFDEVERALPPGAALVGYVYYEDEKPGVDEPRYAAFVWSPSSGEARFFDLGPGKDIDLLVTRWREQFAVEANSGGRAPKLMEQANRAAGLALRRRIWDPLAPALKGASAIYVAPDGPLHLVSLGALPSGQTRYLMETAPVLRYLNTERDLLREAPASPRIGRLLAVGDPAFGEASPTVAKAAWRRDEAPCFDPSQVRFQPLPSSGLEAREVLRVWQRAGGEGVLLEGARATQRLLEQSVSGARVVHLATHGFFYRSRCGGQADASSPLGLSGLALAGSNRDGGGGLLTADRVLRLDLQGAEWAVLSGCDTGLGRTGAGEGVMGLRRAFQLAGVRTVIMSLWPVEDDSARRWMTALYRKRLREHMGTAEAVRAASLELLRQARARHASTHPLYWAPFVAAGDWR